MNEQAINSMYQLAKREGYKKSYEDFTTLLGENEEAMKTMYGLAQQEGYKNSIDDFYGLMGVEKKNFVGSQEEFEPASTEAFLAFTPTSGDADTNLGLSTDKSPEDPSRLLTQQEQEQIKSIDEYKSAPQRRFIDPVTGGEQAVARVPMLAEMESEEMVALQRDKDKEQERKQAEEFREQAERNYKLNPLNNLVINAVDATFENVRNTIASKVATRKDLLSSSQVDMEA